LYSRTCDEQRSSIFQCSDAFVDNKRAMIYFQLVIFSKA
jgi:hypothetical protein